LLDLAPLAHGPEHEHGDDAHAPGGDERTHQQSDALGRVARSGALQFHQRVPDEATRHPAENDGGERCDAGGGRGEGRQGPLLFGHAASVGSLIVRATVVVPTFNEIDNIERLLREVRKVAPDAHVLVVDDGSPDGTAQRADELGAELGNIQVLRRTEKNGLGNAYRAGLRRAIDDGAEICVQMDADLSHDPAVLPALIANVEHGADLAIGSRYVPGGRTVNWPRRRRWLSRWGNRYAAGVLGLAINDATAGYRAYSASALQRMQFEAVQAEGYGFQVEMTYRLVSAGGKVVEFPISFHDRTAGVSKMSGSIISEAFLLVGKLWVSDFQGRRRRRAEGG
jgi:dolichol-phosphate mannosyltransferase